MRLFKPFRRDYWPGAAVPIVAKFLLPATSLSFSPLTSGVTYNFYFPEAPPEGNEAGVNAGRGQAGPGVLGAAEPDRAAAPRIIREKGPPPRPHPGATERRVAGRGGAVAREPLADTALGGCVSVCLL